MAGQVRESWYFAGRVALSASGPVVMDAIHVTSVTEHERRRLDEAKAQC